MQTINILRGKVDEKNVELQYLRTSMKNLQLENENLKLAMHSSDNKFSYNYSSCSSPSYTNKWNNQCSFKHSFQPYNSSYKPHGYNMDNFSRHLH